MESGATHRQSQASSAHKNSSKEPEVNDLRDAKKLCDLCESVYSSFNAARETLDTHLQNKFAELGTNEDESCFISQVVYGLLRYRKYITAFLDSFYHNNSGTALRGDAVKYRVLTYLAAFRLRELTFPTFRLLLEAQDAQKVLVLLEYLFDPQPLQQVCREDWLQVYDKEFVDATISGLLSWRPEVEVLLQQLRQQVYFTQQQQESSDAAGTGSSNSPARRAKPPPTKPKEFKLSQPRPKPLPQPETLPPAPKPKPPPKFRPGAFTREQLAIEAAKAANRQAIEARQADPRHGPFRLRVLERPMHADTVRAEAEADLAAELAKRPRAKPAPPPPAAEV